MDIRSTPFGLQLINQIRALDKFGSWAKLSDVELLTKKYIKTKEELKKVPVIADIDEMVKQDIRILYQALALAFEIKTGVMCNVIMEMSHEGFGRCVVIADKIVIADKYFKDAHRFSFRSLEDLFGEYEKVLENGISLYNKFKECE